MRALVLGTGALASLFAARLARSGRSTVTIAGSWRAGLETIAKDGVTVVEEAACWAIAVRAVELAHALEADLVLVLTKATATERVAATAARAVSGGGLVVTLQNGWGNLETLATAAGRDRVAAGSTTVGATLLAPGRVRAFPGETTLGFDAATETRVAAAASLLTASGLPTRTTRDVDALLWRKLAVNCAINPLSALHRVPNGELLRDPDTRGRLLAAAREVGDVATARGTILGDDPARLALDVAERTAANRSSMLRDLERGVPTEIDVLCGAVAREGRRLGVPTPVNDALWREVRRREGRPAPLDLDTDEVAAS